MSSFDGLNTGTARGGTSTGSPVRGFRANRLFLSRDGGRFWRALAPELPEIHALIERGDLLKIDTRTKSYVERVKDE